MNQTQNKAESSDRNPETAPVLQYESAAPVLDVATPIPEPGIERVGSLTYDKRGLRRLFGWLLWGDFAASLVDRSAGSVIQSALNNSVFKITNFAFANIGTIGMVFAFFFGPIISVKSDRHRGPHGRRRPFLLFAVPISGALLMLYSMAAPVAFWLNRVLGPHSPGRWLHLVQDGCSSPQAYNMVVLVFGTIMLMTSFSGTILGATFGAFINDVVPHTVIARFYGWWRVISLAVGSLFMYYGFNTAAAHYRIFFAAIGMIYGVGYFLAFYKVKEGEYPPPPYVETNKPLVERVWLSVQTYFTECYSKPFYLFLFLAGILAGFGAYPIFTYPLFFAHSFDWPYYGKCTGLCYAAGMIISPISGYLAQKFHPLRMSMITLAVHACVVFTGSVMIRNGFTFGVFFSTANILQMFYNTAAQTNPNRLLPRDKFAMIASASANLGIVMSLFYYPFLGKLLDRTHNHYQYTYTASGICDVLAIAAFMVVFRYFKKHGGDKAYVAP